MNENEYRNQKIIPELESLGYRCYLYGKNGFMPSGHKKRFDILVFHDMSNLFLPSPFGIEIKRGEKFYDITKGIYDQMMTLYAKENPRFKCERENWEGNVPFYVFTTLEAFENGILYTKHFPESSNWFIERFAWRFDASIMYKDKISSHIIISRNNKRYDLNTRKEKFIIYWDD